MALAEMGFGLNGIGQSGYWPNWELDQVALDEMVLDEIGLDEEAIPRIYLFWFWKLCSLAPYCPYVCVFNTCLCLGGIGTRVVLFWHSQSIVMCQTGFDLVLPLT